MPKTDNSFIKFSGKMDDVVFVNSHRYGSHTRKSPRAGSKREEAALKRNYRRTGFLNKLASDINRVVAIESDGHKPSGFYFELQKRFRKEPANSRLLLLCQLRGMNVHPRYTLGRLLGCYQLTHDLKKQTINFELTVTAHPRHRNKTNCYSFELLLICWSKSSTTTSHQRKLSEWVSLKGPLPVFEFSFSRNPKTIHWLLCLKQKLGWNSSGASLKDQGMQIVAVGTFNKREEKLLNKTADSKKRLVVGRSKAEPPRVKPKFA